MFIMLIMFTYNIFFVRAASIDGLVPFLVAWLLCQINIIIFHPNFGDVPLGLDCRCCGSAVRRPTLIIRAVSFEVTQPIRPPYMNVTDGRTDGQTDDLRQQIPRFAGALRGKNKVGPGARATTPCSTNIADC